MAGIGIGRNGWVASCREGGTKTMLYGAPKSGALLEVMAHLGPMATPSADFSPAYATVSYTYYVNVTSAALASPLLDRYCTVGWSGLYNFFINCMVSRWDHAIYKNLYKPDNATVQCPVSICCLHILSTSDRIKAHKVKVAVKSSQYSTSKKSLRLKVLFFK